MASLSLTGAAARWGVPAALAAGFLDGLNPCAITVLLLFVSALLATLSSGTGAQPIGAARLRLWTVAGAYIGGIFSLYLLLGLGFLEIAWLAPLARGHLATRLAGIGAVLLGLAMAAEYFYPHGPVHIRAPAALHGLIRRWNRPATAGAALIGGVLIGLCTVPCGGGLYLGVAGVLSLLESRPLALGLV